MRLISDRRPRGGKSHPAQASIQNFQERECTSGRQHNVTHLYDAELPAFTLQTGKAQLHLRKGYQDCDQAADQQVSQK